MSILVFLFLAAVMASSYYGLLTVDLLRERRVSWRELVNWQAIRAQRKPVRLTLAGSWTSLFMLFFFSLVILLKVF